MNLTHNSFALVKIEKTSPTTFGRYVAKLEYSTPQPSFINSTGAACNGTIVSDLNKVPRGATVTYNTSSNISLV